MLLHNIIEKSSQNAFIVMIMIFALTLGGFWGLKNIPLDAVPDLSDVQVIVYTDWKGRSPSLIEDQITYPIITALLSAPNVKSIRGTSMFGSSYVYVIFKDGTDIYWARSRILEYLDEAKAKLPDDVTPTLGPDATGVGWGFEYALVSEDSQLNLAQLRSFQDWYLRFWLKSVPGVSDVASVGGFVNQYQITIDPGKLLQYKISIQKVVQAVRMSNSEVGGRVIEFNGREYMVRGRGYIKKIADLESVVIDSDKDGAPLLLKNIAQVKLGPDIRRGAADLNGQGEVVGGIVVVRFGEDVLSVIERVKAKLNEVKSSLPKGVKVVTTYDRSELIHNAVTTLNEKLIEESLIVSLVCIVFLFHFRSALVAIITLPLAIIISFLAMQLMGISSNIMSLGGIAIAIGAMVDSAIIMIENAHKHLENPTPGKTRRDLIIEAAKEVGRPLFFALLIITVSFMPIFSLEGQEGKLFKPLAYTKTFAMFFASFLSVTLVPVLMLWLIKGKIIPEHKNPINRFLIWAYNPIAKLTIHYRKTSVIVGILIVIGTVPAYLMLDHEFMPPLYEETLMYMPVTVPGISIEEARKIIIMQDKILKENFPNEVKRVFGKVGRSNTPTDTAPLEMIETIIELYPKSQWRDGYTVLALKQEMDNAISLFGLTNMWTMPIDGRFKMLATGIPNDLGIKIYGDNILKLESIAVQIEGLLKNAPGTSNIAADRKALGGRYIDFDIKRDKIAQYGLTVQSVMEVIESAIGGKNIDFTIEGRERYPINVRYPREQRDSIDTLKKVLVPSPSGFQIELSELVDIQINKGADVIKSENGQQVAYVRVDLNNVSVTDYVENADALIKTNVELPPGYYVSFSGDYQNLERAKKRLMLVIPLTLLIVIVLLYFNIKSFPKILIVLSAIPFSLVGSFWLIYYLEYKLSIAVWVGIIALAGLDAETGVVMLLYLDLAYEKWVKEGKLKSMQALESSVLEGAVKRIRPKIMTVCAILFGLLPVMWSDQTGADVMKRIAAPMVGGVVTSSILELLLYPAIYVLWKAKTVKR